MAPCVVCGKMLKGGVGIFYGHFLLWARGFPPVRDCLYIEPGDVCSLTRYFHIPKGPKNITMVYNGTGCDLNAAFWAPHFGLPYATHTTKSLMPGYYQYDFNAGDMFLNFLLHEELKRMSGVNI